MHNCLCNCNIHFADPGQVGLLESGKAVAQKDGPQSMVRSSKVGHLEFERSFLFKCVTAIDTCLEETEVMERSPL